jgi:hypothetical protein
VTGYTTTNSYGHSYSYSAYFYFEETGEYRYVSVNGYEYNYGGKESSYHYETTTLYDATYYETYIKPYNKYGAAVVTLDSDLMDALNDALMKLKPVV